MADDKEERKESKAMRDRLKKKSQLERKKERDTQEGAEVAKFEEKKEGMRTAEDVIKRISWDEEFLPRDKRELIIVGYLDRFKGLVEESFEDFNWEDDLSSLSPVELAIPQHRIQYFKYNDVIIWDKRNKTDLVFSSAGQGKTLEHILSKNTNR